MANRYRGEISAVLDGKNYNLCLTLGALAELETEFGSQDMVALATRFENGRISASDAQKNIAAGLRGGGTDVTDDEVATMKVEGGAAGYVDVVAKLLQATFGAPGNPNTPACRQDNTNNAGPRAEGGPPPPFPGTT